MVELFLRHTLSRIFDSNLHTVVKVGGKDADTAITGRKLTGIVGQRVEHEEREHLVGLDHGFCRLYIKGDTFHQERRPPFRQEVEERL